jgi:peptidyl-prolyl cis-trans isomerase A (cyclophilin A)
MIRRCLLALAGLFTFTNPAAAQTMQVAIDPEVVPVVIETTMGNITVELDIERAPITAGNFLRYVDEGRLDGTAFYRAMPLEWGDQPNGLIQGGTQYDPDRILPPIAHERTSDTGLNHLRGSISMARYEPGTATGDFSILLQTQTGLDADPDNPDPAMRDGYAVFGYVTSGMEVVEAIHAAPVDPDAGEGWLKGQMLAEPVQIVRVRRVTPQ